MQSLLISYKFLFMTLMSLPLALCSSESDNEPETPVDIEASAQLVELKSVRSMTPHNACKGYQWKDIDYPNANLTLGSRGDSNIIGEFGASDADAELDFRMTIARKKTIDKNKETWSGADYIRGGNYDLLDAVMTQTDYYFYKKGGGVLFISKDKKYKIERYIFGDRYVEGFALSSAAQFTSHTNGYALTLEQILDGNIYYTEDDIFSYEDATSVTVYRFVDYRMLLQLRFLIRNGARDVSLIGFKEGGGQMAFSLNDDSDLIALSEEFESNNIETIIFSAKGDYRIDYFNGTIYSREAGDGKSHEILYKNGNPVFD
ncbi:hypothetical protein [Flavisericum labens]|uniref:hypothetical protein n=1 Tax=Flavisericum labens TaxID=3377112 RepID=UPI00387A9E6C